jgi:hypothetical protein
MPLDPLEWTHRVIRRIPAPRQHTVRQYGAHAKCRKEERLWRRKKWHGEVPLWIRSRGGGYTLGTRS